MMKRVIVIPARYGSTRFPGKPLAKIAGRSLIERAWRLANSVQTVDATLVATDDQRIADHVSEFGGTVIMTSESCRNGSERVLEAVQSLSNEPEVIVNFQGDAVLTPPEWLAQIISAVELDPNVSVATPAVHLDQNGWSALEQRKALGGSGGTLVVFDSKSNALYFSRALIPSCRTSGVDPLPYYRHIGIYAYRRSALERYVTLAPTPLEKVEQLEQLRLLEHGIPIRVVPIESLKRTLWSVDNPEDVAVVEQIIQREGELVQ